MLLSVMSRGLNLENWYCPSFLSNAHLNVQTFPKVRDSFNILRHVIWTICLDFAFTQFYIAREIIVGDNKPSLASGITLDAYTNAVIDDPESHVVWLLEPHRHTYVEKWSGTMIHTNARDKLSQTVSAFVHFAYHWTRNTMVFADVQSQTFSLFCSWLLAKPFRPLYSILEFTN